MKRVSITKEDNNSYKINFMERKENKKYCKYKLTLTENDGFKVDQIRGGLSDFKKSEDEIRALVQQTTLKSFDSLYKCNRELMVDVTDYSTETICNAINSNLQERKNHLKKDIDEINQYIISALEDGINSLKKRKDYCIGCFESKQEKIRKLTLLKERITDNYTLPTNVKKLNSSFSVIPKQSNLSYCSTSTCSKSMHETHKNQINQSYDISTAIQNYWQAVELLQKNRTKIRIFPCRSCNQKPTSYKDARKNITNASVIFDKLNAEEGYPNFGLFSKCEGEISPLKVTVHGEMDQNIEVYTYEGYKSECKSK